TRRRRKTKRDVFDQLDEDAAQAESDELSETRIGDRADDDFLRPGPELLLHLNAFDRCVRVVLARVRDDLRVRFTRRRTARDAGDHAAGFGLMKNVGRDELQDDREAHFFGEARGLVGRARKPLLRNGDTAGVGDLLRLGGAEGGAALLLRALEDGAYRGGVDLALLE